MYQIQNQMFVELIKWIYNLSDYRTTLVLVPVVCRLIFVRMCKVINTAAVYIYNSVHLTKVSRKHRMERRKFHLLGICYILKIRSSSI